MNAMAKFLVPLTIFLLASHVHGFISLSSVAGNQVRVNQMTRLQQQMSDPTSEPSSKPRFEPTYDQTVNDQTTNQRLEWDAELPTILSSKQEKYGLSQKQNAKLPCKITISITQITSNAKPFEAVNGINTSYTFEAVNCVNAKLFEAVNGVINAQDKYIVTDQVTFSDKQDSEILSESPVQCNS